jgi:hypothetical protein
VFGAKVNSLLNTRVRGLAHADYPRLLIQHIHMVSISGHLYIEPEDIAPTGVPLNTGRLVGYPLHLISQKPFHAVINLLLFLPRHIRPSGLFRFSLSQNRRNPYLEWDSNPRSERCKANFVTYNARSL